MKQSAARRLEKQLGRELAFFCLCAVFDIPYDTDIKDRWEDYKDKKTIEGKTFADGDMDFVKAQRSGESQEMRWSRDWGYGDKNNQYSEKDYIRLDELKKTMLGQLDDTGTVTAQQNDVAKTCSIWALQREKLSAKGNKDSIAMAKTLDDMIRKNLEDCNMRSKDIMPSEEQRLDGFIDAVKEKYGLTLEMTMEDVQEMIAKWFAERRMPYTMDAQEHILKAIINTMRKNDDLPELLELPEEYKMDAFGFSFESDPDDVENGVYRYLGIVRNDREKRE